MHPAERIKKTPNRNTTRIFLFGIFYLVSITGMSYYKAIQVGLLPFIPSELFKIALALFLIPDAAFSDLQLFHIEVAESYDFALD